MSGYFLRKFQGSGVRYELGAVWEQGDYIIGFLNKSYPDGRKNNVRLSL